MTDKLTLDLTFTPFGRQGSVYVETVYSDGLAEALGIAKFDKLTSLCGQPVSSASDVRAILNTLAPDATMTASVLRGSPPATVELGPTPGSASLRGRAQTSNPVVHVVNNGDHVTLGCVASDAFQIALAAAHGMRKVSVTEVNQGAGQVTIEARYGSDRAWITASITALNEGSAIYFAGKATNVFGYGIGKTSKLWASAVANAAVRYSPTPPTQSDTKACPWCAEDIKAAAQICRFCNREV